MSPPLPPLPPHRTPDGQADLLRRLAFALYVGEHNQYVGALQVLLPPPPAASTTSTSARSIGCSCLCLSDQTDGQTNGCSCPSPWVRIPLTTPPHVVSQGGLLERLVAAFKAGVSLGPEGAALQVQALLCVRVLAVRIAPEHLTTLWPVALEQVLIRTPPPPLPALPHSRFLPRACAPLST